MDRRDALKKLGMGGATIVGASMVVSSPAFAADGTPTCGLTGAVNLSITSSEAGDVTSIGVAPGAATCPCSGAAPGIATSSWTLSKGTLTSLPTANPATWTGVTGNADYTVTVRLTCEDGGSKNVCSTANITGRLQQGPTPGTLTFAAAIC